MHSAWAFQHLVLILLPSVVRGLNTCLNPDNYLYDSYCRGRVIALSSCNLVDDDLVTDVPACFDAADGGRASVTAVRMNYNALREIPTALFDGMTSLSILELNFNRLSTLPAGLFAGLESLTTLEVQNNQLASLPVDLFEGQTTLTRLSMYENSLTTLPEGIFAGTSALTSIALRANAFETLPGGIFEGLTELKYLYLNQNGMTTLPADLFQGLPSLYSLYLKENSLASLEAGLFDGLGSLYDIHLENNLLTAAGLPTVLGTGLDSLRLLFLQDNQLSTLPETFFQGLPALATMYLQENVLETLPAGLFQGLDALSAIFLGADGNEDLQCVPANDATQVVLPTNYVAGICGCTPAEDVFCEEGLACQAGPEGYTCGDVSGPTPVPTPAPIAAPTPVPHTAPTPVPAAPSTPAPVAGLNACFDSGGVDYRCSGRRINLKACDLTDADAAMLRTCFETASSVDRIKTINLNRNSFTTLPSDLLEGMTGLKKLKLRKNCDLTCVPAKDPDGVDLDLRLSTCNDDAGLVTC